MKRYRTINVTLRQWLTCPGQYQLIQTQSNVCVCVCVCEYVYMCEGKKSEKKKSGGNNDHTNGKGQYRSWIYVHLSL